jgi:NADH-quinone oxidoreductase subunit E
VGINPERLLMDWVSASEANRFAQVVDDFTQSVRQLGPLETKEIA